MVKNARIAESHQMEPTQTGSVKSGLLAAIRSSKIAKWASISGSVFVSGGAVELTTTASPAAASPNTYLKCNLNAPPNKAQLCGETKAQAEKFCSTIGRTSQLLLDVKGKYTDASRKEHESKYQIKFEKLTPGGCSLAGKEEDTAGQLFRSGTTGTFEPNGQVVHFNVTNDEGLNDRHIATVGFEAPLDCAAGIAGSAVRPYVKVEWIPDPGWTTMGPTQSTVLGSPETIC